MEEWKTIKDYERYQISNNGNVISNTYKMQGKKLKQSQVGRNEKKLYSFVFLTNGSNNRSIGVHRLVAIAFIPNPLNKPCVNHIDSNPSNNHYTNLEWVTYSENAKHGQDYGDIDIEHARKYRIIKQKLQAKIKYNLMCSIQFGDIKLLRAYKPAGKDAKGDYVCKRCNSVFVDKSIRSIITGRKKRCQSCSVSAYFRRKKVEDIV